MFLDHIGSCQYVKASYGWQPRHASQVLYCNMEQIPLTGHEMRGCNYILLTLLKWMGASGYRMDTLLWMLFVGREKSPHLYAFPQAIHIQHCNHDNSNAPLPLGDFPISVYCI